jgi:hypothetical protein
MLFAIRADEAEPDFLLDICVNGHPVSHDRRRQAHGIQVRRGTVDACGLEKVILPEDWGSSIPAPAMRCCLH